MDIKTHQHVIERLCQLVSEVGSIKFHDETAHDCFCGLNPFSTEENFRLDEEILIFIEKAVHEKLAK